MNGVATRDVTDSLLRFNIRPAMRNDQQFPAWKPKPITDASADGRRIYVEIHCRWHCTVGSCAIVTLWKPMTALTAGQRGAGPASCSTACILKDDVEVRSGRRYASCTDIEFDGAIGSHR